MNPITEPTDDLERLFLTTPSVQEPLPPVEYIVTYGCGVHVIALPDGGLIEIDDHVEGCEHRRDTQSSPDAVY